MSYKFSSTSKERLETCDQSLQDVFNLAIKRSPIDFGVACGERTIEEQKELYRQGRTKSGNIVTNVDGVKNISKHNHSPSQAVDIYAYFNGKAQWEVKHLCMIAGVVMSCADELGVSIRWGGNWNQNGEIISDQNFQDLPHFEI